MATTSDIFSSEQGSKEVGEPNSITLPIAEKESSEPEVVKDDLLAWIQEELNAADKHVKRFRDKALECYRFKAGKQMDPKAESELLGQGRPHNAFNTAQRYIRFVSGIERLSPELLIFAPEEEFDTQAQMDAESVTRSYEWEQRTSAAPLERSRAFDDLLTCGVGCMDKWVNSTDSLREKIASRRVSPLELLWPECLAGDTPVRSSPVRAGYRRLYTGELIDVHLESGNRLTVTPNHPVLTKVGWQAAGALRVGHQLVDGALIDRLGVSPSYFDHVESGLQERAKFRSVGVGARRTPSTLSGDPRQFHGDGGASKVYEVWADSHLGNELPRRLLLKEFLEMLLAGAPQRSARRNAVVTQAVAYGMAMHAEVMSDFLRSPSGVMEREHVCELYLANMVAIAACWRAVQFQPIPDGLLTDPESPSDLRSRQALLKIKAGDVGDLLGSGLQEPPCVRINGISRRHVNSFPVWNLTTDSGFFIAGGVLTSNCDQQNMRGTRWRAREIFMDKDDVIRRWPDAEQKAKAYSLGGFQGRPDSAEVKYVIPYVTTEDQGKKPSEGSRPRKLKVLEFQWWDEEEGYVFKDPLQGDITWMEKDRFQEYNRRLMAVKKERIEGFEEKDQKVYRRIYLLERAHQLGDIGRMAAGRFTINFMTALWDEDERQWYGLMRVLIDPQKYANKFFNQLIEIVGKQAKDGFILEDGAVEPKHRREWEENYSKPGTSQFVAEGSISGNKIMPKPRGELPQTAMGILQFCITSMETVTGLAPAVAGLDSGNVQQGTLRQRQHAGLVLLAHEFDALAEFRIEEAHITQSLLKVIADGRMIFGGQNPYDPFVFRLDRKIFEKQYAVYLDDTEHDPSLRARFSSTILGLMPTLMRSGNWVPELWDFIYDLPVRAREKIKQAFIQKQQQQMQMIQMGINPSGKGTPRDPAEQQAKVQKLNAEAAALFGKAEALAKGHAARDFRSIVQALAESERVKLERDELRIKRSAHGTNEAKSMVDIAHGVANLFSPPQPPGGSQR